MRTNTLKKKSVILLTAMMLISALFGMISLNAYKASADATLDQIVTEFAMHDKQEVRFAVNDGDPKGMRFAAILGASDYENLQNAGYDQIEYGYFIMPAYYESRIGEINEANTFGSSAKYTWSGKEGSVGTYTVIHKSGAIPVMDVDDGVSQGNYLVKGSVVGMFEQNLATKYTARMYIKATKGTAVEYKFATAPTANSSMIDVAIRAMDGGVEDSSLQGYITTYENWYENKNGFKPTYSYTINYVVGDEIVKTDVVSGIAINTKIDLTASAPVGYAIDSSKTSVLSGKVYADNDLTLTVYVKGSEALIGNLYNGELYHFEKRADVDAAIVLPKAIGAVSTVKIGEVDLDSASFSYDDSTQTLTVNKDAVAELATGDFDMSITNESANYSAKVTVADVIVNTEDELYSSFEYISGEIANHCTDYIILGNDIICESVYTRTVTAYRMGIFDGKGHVIKNLNVTKPFTASLQSVSTFKNVAFLNATNASTSGFLGADSGTYVFDNVSIIFNENKGGGLVNYSAGNMTFKNSVMIDLNSSSSTTVGYISRTYDTSKTTDFADSCVISDKAPFQDGTDTTTTVYTSALAMRKATDANAWFESLNGVLPDYLNNSWSFDTYGNLYCFGHVVFRVTKEIVGTKTAGELFYFSKDVTSPTGYAGAYVSNDCYNVTLPDDVGTINTVTIAGTNIEGFSYTNKVLSIPVSVISTLANGVATMEIDASTAYYKATVTIASLVMKTEADLLLLTTLSNTSSDLMVLDGNINWTKTYEYEKAQHLYATLDGKGYAISNMVLGKTDGSSIAGLFTTFQGGLVKNLALLNVSFGPAVWRGGVLAGEVNKVNTDNVFISIAEYVGVNGLVLSFAGGTSNIKNTIVYYPSMTATGTAGGFSSTYGDSINVVVENSFVITSNQLVITTENTNNTNVDYDAMNALACADLAELLTESENLKNFDSSYWTIDDSGNVCFGGNIVIAKG